VRALEIASQLTNWGADIAGLSEFRGSAPSAQIAASLDAAGLVYQLTTVDPLLPNRNALLLASRWPLRRLRLRLAPREPGRWLVAEVLMPEEPITVCLMHAPNMVTGRKMPFLQAVDRVAASWRRGPGLIMGDTNCGWPGLDEERPVFNPATKQWLDGLAARGWCDAFRLLSPEERCYTWFSPNGGNGFRLDEAFVNRKLQPRLSAAFYAWGVPSTGEGLRRDVLSDHAALLVDLV
jgi:hypothetical protein